LLYQIVEPANLDKLKWKKPASTAKKSNIQKLTPQQQGTSVSASRDLDGLEPWLPASLPPKFNPIDFTLISMDKLLKTKELKRAPELFRQLHATKRGVLYFIKQL
jgi:hypothetical protein